MYYYNAEKQNVLKKSGFEIIQSNCIVAYLLSLLQTVGRNRRKYSPAPGR